MRFRISLSLVVAAFAALPATASASEMIARNATHVSLAVNRSNVALLNYRAGGRRHHTLAWGAINARTPNRSLKQISFRLDYSGGWGSRRKDLWRGFKNACGRYEGPALRYVVAACTARDGSHWVVQKWRRLLPPFGLRPTFAQRTMELHLSHWSGTFRSSSSRSTGCTSGSTISTAGSSTRARASTASRRPSTAPRSTPGAATVFVDTYNSRYGRGWKRENGFLTHRGSGAFCYGFYSHGKRPVGKGSEYRATVMGPGVMPILFWQGDAPGPYDPQLDEIAFQEQQQLFRNSKCRHR